MIRANFEGTADNGAFLIRHSEVLAVGLNRSRLYFICNLGVLLVLAVKVAIGPRFFDLTRIIVPFAFVISSSHRQQVGMAWREHIVLDEPERIISEPTTDSCLSVILYELAEIVSVDNLRFRSRCH